MRLKSEQPIIYFDCETTGLNLGTDKIIQLAVVKVDLNTKKIVKKKWMFNPDMPIPKEATEIHGITNEMVSDSPRFKFFAEEIVELLKSGIPAGYNINTYDLPLIKRELLEADQDVSFMNTDSFVTLDLFRIVKQLFPRNLGDVYKRYTGKDLDESHDALADTMACVELTSAMMQQEGSIPDTILEINKFYYDPKFDDVRKADITGKLTYNPEGEVVFNFGKFKDKLVRDKDPDIQSYCVWIINSPDKFAKDTIDIIKTEMLK